LIPFSKNCGWLSLTAINIPSGKKFQDDFVVRLRCKAADSSKFTGWIFSPRLWLLSLSSFPPVYWKSFKPFWLLLNFSGHRKNSLVLNFYKKA